MKQMSQVGFLRAQTLLIRVQSVRFARQLTGGLRLFGKRDAGAKRDATPGKSRNSWLFGAFIALSMAYVFTNIAYHAVSNIGEALGSVRLLSTAMPKAAPSAKAGAKPATAQRGPAVASQRTYSTRPLPLPPAEGFALPAKVLKALALEALLFFIAIILMPIANGELTRADWDLEWLATMPVPLTTLLSARIFARSVTNQIGIFALVPFLAIVAWFSGYREAVLLAGLAASIPLFVIAATVQTICDTGLRLRFGPARMRNLQAGISILAIIVLFCAISAGTPAKTGYILQWGPVMPSWMSWLPPGLAIRAVAADTSLAAAGWLAVLSLQAAICMVLGLGFVSWELRSGLAASGTRETGRRERGWKKVRTFGQGGGRRILLTPIQARELLLLGRDRTFLVQTLIMPMVLVGAQVFFNVNASGLLSFAQSHPETIAAMAFGISAYALMFSAFQTLNAEGGALWILYCVPKSLESILRQKSFFWGAACLVYPAFIFGWAGYYGGGAFSARFGELVAIVLIGIPVFAVIATSLGVFACDPLAQTVQRRIKLSYTYLYMLLSSFYIYSVYASSIWQRLALLILTALLAGALWQKARDHLPYLLDPAASPPSRVSVSDGMIAALLFFVLQNIVILLRIGGGRALSGDDIVIAFSVAGAITYCGMRLTFWRLHSEGVPRTFGPGLPSALVTGFSAGIVCAGVAFLYLALAKDTPLLEHAKRTILFGAHGELLFALLAIVAAPLFEEFIFRGLIFGGLRRSLGFTASMLASAAVFAIVHPPASVIPVFGLGLAAAFVYERTRLLIAPMAAHAAYNALIVGSQLFF
jgi:ABC-2 type transport system permease protein